jgi:cyclase
VPGLRLASLFLFVLCASATAQVINTGPVKLHEAADGIYGVEAVYAGANAAVIIGDQGVTVVDTHGSPASAAALRDAIAGITDKPIRYVVNTHWHVDHHSGNEAYLQSWADGVSIISHHTTREDIPTLGAGQYADTRPYRALPVDLAAKHLASGTGADGAPLTAEQREQVAKFHAAQEQFVKNDEQFEFTLANLTIDRSLTIHDGKNTAEILYLHPAHTRGDLVVWMPESKVLMVGDILTQPILWTWSSHPQDYIRTLAALEALEPESVIIGHGGPVLQGTGYLRTVREFMQAVVDFARRSEAQRLDVEDALSAAAGDPALNAFSNRFIKDEAQAGMFAQMIAWTVERAILELRGELEGD